MFSEIPVHAVLSPFILGMERQNVPVGAPQESTVAYFIVMKTQKDKRVRETLHALTAPASPTAPLPPPWVTAP